MIKVWVLIALVGNGHMSWPMVPTLEFSSQAMCERAIIKLKKETDERQFGKFSGFCTEIEK